MWGKAGNYSQIEYDCGGFTRGEVTSSSKESYLRPVHTAISTLVIFFSIKDAKGVLPHENDPIVISLQMQSWQKTPIVRDGKI